MFRELKPDEARQSKPTDKFFVQAAGLNVYGQRQYTITNLSRKPLPTVWVVTFMRSTTGVKLAHCTCPDFNINLHQCKHLLPCAGLHVAILRGIQRDEAQQLQTRSAERTAIMASAAAV